ncbi:4Fe-4S cluster-binding domain-containing protein [Clostridium sp. KNHs205]|jgi:MoaA/NifB/PqqE/SkfB family radical SAM enzyme|uniref:4Fe-4S cluster-binding domain-containing protein n=1 Tax=Clostridium sp. KNHs205 TaxID=1449050 RepID=UPI00051B5015|nr:4Fe-4S cluster-binding domain-containing protein [Clostridium sp. KNHs205]
MYFRLNSNVYKVGEFNSTLYDAKSNKWYQVDKDGGMILDLCEKNICIQDFDMNTEHVYKFLDKLKIQGLGKYYKNTIHIDKILPYAPVLVDKQFLLTNLYIEYTDSCNLNCNICNSKKTHWKNCRSCILHNDSQQVTNNSIRESYISFISKYRPLNVIIRGGNPFYNDKEMFFAFLEDLDNKHKCNITIIWNGLELSENDMERLLHLKSKIIFNIVFMGISSHDYDVIGLDFDIFIEQYKMLAMFDNNKINYMITVNYQKNMKSSLSEIDHYFISNVGRKPMICEVIDDSEKIESSTFDRKLFVPTFNEIDFYSRRKFNPCLYGALSINCDGSLSPCPGITHKVGEVYEDGSCNINIDLKEIYWKKTKNSSNICKNCGLKYICFDCSVFQASEECDSFNENMSTNLKLERDSYKNSFIELL